METRAIKLCSSLLISATIVISPIGHAAKVAGTLERMDGDVLVSPATGNHYRAAQPGQPLELGDRILTLQGASAAVVQADGCVTELAENMAFTLQTPSVCQGGISTLRQVGPYYAQAIGGEETPSAAPAQQPAAAEKTPEAKTPEEVAKQGEQAEPSKKKKKKQYWWAALAVIPLALLGGGGGSSSNSTTNH